MLRSEDCDCEERLLTVTRAVDDTWPISLLTVQRYAPASLGAAWATDNVTVPSESKRMSYLRDGRKRIPSRYLVL